MLEEALQKLKIPYIVPFSQPFWCRTEVQDMAAFLRVIANPEKADAELLQTVLTRPDRGLSSGE